MSVHPDHVGRDEQKLAHDVFNSLTTMYEQAKSALENGKYNAEFSARSSKTFVLHAGSQTYTLYEDVSYEGDFSDVHIGHTTEGKEVYAKIALDPTYNQYLEHEVVIYKSMNTNGNTDALRYVPELLDSLLVELGGSRKVRVNIFRHESRYVSLTEIRNVYPNGLHPKDAAWIWRRVIGQTLTAVMHNVVHGAIVPDHTLVHPVSHDPVYIGWTHSVVDPETTSNKLTTRVDRWSAWYPEEILNREAPTHATDVYMAGKTMIYLLGGNTESNSMPKAVPREIQRIVRACVSLDAGSRPHGHVVLQKFTKTIHRLWGKEYRELKMSK
jgi:hypothetical protein